MAGRKRRGSTSSVEATSSRVHWCQESSVLHAPVPGTLEDDWPIFELKNAVVLNRDAETLENALDVLYKGPFIVRGHMVLDDKEQKRHLIMNVRSSVPIEISACTRYSVGEADDNTDEEDVDMSRCSRPPVLWLGGRGAWFEINPSAAYLPMYRNICEAIRLYYAIYDYYSSRKAKSPKQGSKSIDPIERLSDVFLNYSVKVGNGLTVEEVAQKCRDLAPFFINQFLQSKEEEKFWQGTFFYRWITKEHDDLFKRAKQAIRSPAKGPVPSINHKLPSRSKRGTSDSINEISVLGSQEPVTRNRSTRSRSSAQGSAAKSSGPEESISSRQAKTNSHPAIQQAAQPERVESSTPNSTQDVGAPWALGNGQSAFDTILESLEWAGDELAKTKKGITKTGLLNKLYFTFKFPNFKNGQPGCHRIPVEEALHYNASALIDALDVSKWEDNDFYPWLKEMTKTDFSPVAFKLSDLPCRMLPRSSRPYQPRGPNASFSQPSVVTGVSTHQGDNDDNTSFDELETPRRGRGKGVKTPGRLGKSSLRPAASSKKRPRSDVDSDSESETRGAKRSHYFSDADDTMEDAETSGLEHKEEDEDLVKIVLRADKIPSTVPRGPNETWTCDQEDCDYIVRGADAEECQERIQVHFKEHEEQTQRVQLALTESRGHLPINHLLDKIKQLGDRAQGQEELSVGGITLPRPIQRKLIV